jgi:hypothetical protein
MYRSTRGVPLNYFLDAAGPRTKICLFTPNICSSLPGGGKIGPSTARPVIAPCSTSAPRLTRGAVGVLGIGPSRDRLKRDHRSPLAAFSSLTLRQVSGAFSSRLRHQPSCKPSEFAACSLVSLRQRLSLSEGVSGYLFAPRLSSSADFHPVRCCVIGTGVASGAHLR